MLPSENVLYTLASIKGLSLYALSTSQFNFTLHFLFLLFLFSLAATSIHYYHLPHHTQRSLYKLLLISIGYGQLVTLYNNNKQYFNYTYWIMSQRLSQLPPTSFWRDVTRFEIGNCDFNPPIQCTKRNIHFKVFYNISTLLETLIK